MRWCVSALLACLPAGAQSVRVYSEFQRPDPFGGIVAVDRAPRPREILSPAVARNAFASFHVAVTLPRGETAIVYIQENPDILPYTLYRERFVKTAQGWIPDRLEKITQAALTVPQPEIAGQTTYVYWLDLWVPATTPVERIRVEVQVHCGDQWVQYPMEVRVQPAVVPPLGRVSPRMPRLAARADAFACASERPGASPAATVRDLIFRNSRQDRALAAHKGLRWNAGCSLPPPEGGAEWYLKERDKLLRLP